MIPKLGLRQRRWKRRWLYIPFFVVCAIMERTLPQPFSKVWQNDLMWLAATFVVTEIFVRAVPRPSPSFEEGVRSWNGKAWNWLGGLGCLVALGMTVFVLLIASHVSGPKLSERELSAAEPPLAHAFSNMLDINTNDPRLYSVEHRALGHVRIYVPKEAWERIPFPEREAAAKALGLTWCRALGKENRTLSPSLSIRDIRSGEEMAYHRCW